MGPKTDMPMARFAIGDVVRHKLFDFRGIIFAKEQPFYHLLAENAETTYVAYVSQQNLVADDSEEPVDHPDIGQMFDRQDGRYRLRPDLRN